MKIWVLSDLHESPAGSRFRPSQTPDHDVLVLAGDIGWSPKATVAIAAELTDRPIILVAGNHEFYGGDWNLTIDELRDEASKIDHVHFLENDALQIGHITFLGCTLWTDFNFNGRPADDMMICKHSMMDFRAIAHRSRRLKPADQLARHRESYAWLDDKFLAAGLNSVFVVVTHHAPCSGSVNERFAEDPVTAAYVSVLDEVVRQSNIWIHGHVHHCCDYSVGQCRVVCNPRGFGHEWGKNGFDAGKVINFTTI